MDKGISLFTDVKSLQKLVDENISVDTYIQIVDPIGDLEERFNNHIEQGNVQIFNEIKTTEVLHVYLQRMIGYCQKHHDELITEDKHYIVFIRETVFDVNEIYHKYSGVIRPLNLSILYVKER